jgi:hypothetical protein
MIENKAQASKSEHSPAEAGRSGQKPTEAAIPLRVRDSVRDINISLPNGSESNAHARAESKTFRLTDYPQTAGDVLTICNAINSPMTQEQAQAYLDHRTVADWHQGAGGTGRKIGITAIPADIRRWIDREKAEKERNKAQNNGSEDRYAGIIGGEYIPRN